MEKRRRKANAFLFGICLVFMVWLQCACQDDETKSDYDPTATVTLAGFMPVGGGSASQLVINGSNFGNDTALVKVYVNDKEASVINLNDNYIYAIVPARAGTGPVKVVMGKGEHTKEVVSDSVFKYEFKDNVSTLVGRVNETQDGSFEEANLYYPQTLLCDKYGDIFVIEYSKGIRIVSTTGRQVTTPMRYSVRLLSDLALSKSQDTLFVGVENNDPNLSGVLMMTRREGFTDAKELVRGSGWGVAVNPVDGELFHSQYTGSVICRYDFKTKTSVPLYNFGGDGRYTMCFAPDGKRLYMIRRDGGTIFYADYDFNTKAFVDKPQVLPGTENVGWGNPTGCCCDEEGNLYVADCMNHCIRKVTPGGVVSVYIGTPGVGGYKDGLRKNALLQAPDGVCFDTDGNMYVGDTHNYRIRKVVYE